MQYFFGNIWQMTLETYGGVAIEMVINGIQVMLLFWVCLEHIWLRLESVTMPDASMQRIRSMRRIEVYRHHVAPLARLLMLLAPSLGLIFSTGIGAVGMGRLGRVIGMTDQTGLMRAMAQAYEEISHAYFLMVGGTFPILTGLMIVFLARRFEQEETNALGGSTEELTLYGLHQLIEHIEAGQRQTQAHAQTIHTLLAKVIKALEAR